MGSGEAISRSSTLDTLEGAEPLSGAHSAAHEAFRSGLTPVRGAWGLFDLLSGCPALRVVCADSELSPRVPARSVLPRRAAPTFDLRRSADPPAVHCGALRNGHAAQWSVQSIP